MMNSFSNMLYAKDNGDDFMFNVSGEVEDFDLWQFFYVDCNGVSESDITVEYPAGEMLPSNLAISTLVEDGFIYDESLAYEYKVKNGVVYQNNAIVGIYRKVAA